MSNRITRWWSRRPATRRFRIVLMVIYLAVYIGVGLLVILGCTPAGVGTSSISPVGYNGETVIFEGDSVTSGYAGVESYADRLTTENWNAAVGGSVIENLTSRMPSEIAQGSFTGVYVMIGINDIALQGDSLAKLTADLANLESALGFQPTYLTITPMTSPNATRLAWNDWLRSNRNVIDCGDIFGPTLPDAYRIDHVHLNAAGHTLLASCVQEALDA